MPSGFAARIARGPSRRSSEVFAAKTWTKSRSLEGCARIFIPSGRGASCRRQPGGGFRNAARMLGARRSGRESARGVLADLYAIGEGLADLRHLGCGV